VVVPPPGEAVADGAARQAAWVLSGGERPPAWQAGAQETQASAPDGPTRDRYRRAATAAAALVASADNGP
jgi:xylulokinase